MAQSTATMSPAYSARDALFFCIGVRSSSYVLGCMECAASYHIVWQKWHKLRPSLLEALTQGKACKASSRCTRP